MAANRDKPSGSCTEVARAATRLSEDVEFGSNPGDLRMFTYAPRLAQAKRALVVALHGCGQTAAQYDHGTGWGTLADRCGFVVVFPEQRRSNNPNTCFSWFQPGDTARDQGEAHSIRQMVEHAIVTHDVDRDRVFITGLSAGGAMTAVMLATYPELFAAGAVIAGLPYGAAKSIPQALEAMFTDQAPATLVLGDRVRSASGHKGPWPRIAIWHGSGDAVVKPSNADNLVRQWANVHGLPLTATHVRSIGRHTHRSWTDASGATLIDSYAIAGMAHGVPIATSAGADTCGAPGPYFLDVGVSSTLMIAHDWGVVPVSAPASQHPSEPASTGPILVRIEAPERPGPGAQEYQYQHPVPVTAPKQPSAAGVEPATLDTPSATKPTRRRTWLVDPGSIIQAALKAAGLKR